ncbi:hypothetical protein Y032_0234g3136 [Ancylostoma ceylanicum]|uniref:Protein kinase domain-containing protein n=1 Tax=Ancylostoma ceylanicum TaxID=53326 RepID=A0A016SEU5_9BILA|nr:hypothetical protein Y032_0234g3136 [Ancylostoma ceylanicum]
MLGRNLTELRKAQNERRFSVHTVRITVTVRNCRNRTNVVNRPGFQTVRVGVQMVEALKAVHDLGFLHR